MLIARGRTRLGAADLRWALIFGPRIWSVAVSRTGLVFDTRRIPAATGAPRPGACLYLLARGTWTVHVDGGSRIEAPAAFVVSEEQLEGGDGTRPFTFIASGHPLFSAIEIHVDREDLGVGAGAAPVPVPIGAPSWAAVEETLRVCEGDDAEYRAAFSHLVECLADDGALTRDVASRALRGTAPPFEILWKGLRPMIERLYLSPTLQELGGAMGVSLRQVDRYVRSFVGSFGIVGDHWRSTTRHFRLKLAVILLSAEGATVGEVAATVGYGSSDAMARAFRDAGLPSPAAVQELVADERRGA